MGKKPKPAAPSAEAVRVIIRCRPFSSQEIKDKRKKVVQMDTTMGTIRVVKPGEDAQSAKNFTFDRVFDEDCTQREVYEIVARPIVEAAMDGFNGTIFAYGQTGTGKSFSMVGVYEKLELRGIIPNSFVHIFEDISKNENNTEFLVRASYLEIYNEEVRDLLSKTYTKKLELKEHPDTGVYVKGLSAFVVKSYEEIDRVMQQGNSNRQVASTNMNSESSRSHSIFTITIESSSKGPDGQDRIKVGKLNMVDLAGSEKQSKTGAEGDRLKEGVNINLSLSALGNVISALTDPKAKHIPYRDSKLTRLLQDSLGGNSKTVMITAIGPAEYNYDETMSTLRYANRAKNIKNKPKINEDPKDAMLRQFQEEIERLKKQLEGGGAIVEYSYYSDEDEEESLEESDGEGGVRRVKKPKKKKGGRKGKGKGKKDKTFSEEQLKEKEKEIEAEKERLRKQKGMAEEEKKKAAEELADQQARLEEERKNREALASKLKAMEGKLLVGGISVVELAEQQKRELEQERIKMEEQQREEERLRLLLEQQQEEMATQQDKYDSMAQEADVKTKKLKKLWNKLEQAKLELNELEENGRIDKEELVEEIRSQTRDLKLCKVIIDNFIPVEEVEKVRKHAVWNDDEKDYTLRLIAQRGETIERMARPVAHPDHKRPMSEYALYAIKCGANHARFKMDNILQLELDLPDRTTRDYEGPSHAPRVAAALEAALAQEDDMEFAAMENLPGLHKNYAAQHGARPMTRSKGSRRL